MGKNNTIKLTSISVNDYGELIKFLSSFNGDGRDPDFWQNRLYFWWDKNPAFSEELERGWIFRRNDNKIVGFLGNIPTIFQILSKKVIVFNLTTWRVVKKYRYRSMELLFKSIKYANNSILFNTTANDAVKNINNVLKFKHFPFSPTYSHITLVNPYNVLKIYFNIHRLLIALVYPMLLFLKYYQYVRLISKSKFSYVIRIFKVDSQFDDLWEKTKYFSPNTNIRTSEVINWYCFGNQNFKKILFGYFKNNELQAYAIFNIEIDKKLKILVCSDLWGINVDKKMVRSFCFSAMKYAKDNKVDIVRYPHFDNHLGNIYKKLGLFRYKVIDNRALKTSAEKIKVLNEKETYLTYFQGDYGL